MSDPRRLPEPMQPRDEVDEEIRFHLDRKVEGLVRAGMSREAAEEEARRRFGNVETIRREMARTSRRRVGRMRMTEWIDGWRQDVVFGMRQLARNRVFAAVAVLTLTLGIGVNTAIFSVVDGILFRPLAFPESDELVNVWTDVSRRGGPDDEWLSWANFHDLRERSRTLEALAAWGGWAPTWTDPAQPEQLLGARVSWDMFSGVLGVEPALGRAFEPEDDDPDAPTVVLLSHPFWERAFGGDPAVVGRTLTLNDASMRVVGVMPEGFRPTFIPNADLWAPAQVDPAQQAPLRGGYSWRAVGRASDRASVEEADAEMAELGRRLEAEYPESNTEMSFRAVGLRADVVAPARAGLLVLLGAVGVVLLVACVNVANLLLARSSTRASELAVRAALGAGRRRITRQLLTESLVLAAVGGVAGTLLAFAGTELLVSLAPAGTPRIEEVGVDGRVLAFTAGVTMLAGVFFGLVPALRAGAADLHDALREGGRGRTRTSGRGLRAALVVGQVALALVLLVGAGLLVRSFANLRTADLGFEPEGVLTARVNLGLDRYDREARATFARSLVERLEAAPGAVSVGITGTVPLTGFDGDVDFHVEGRPLPEPGRAEAAWIRGVTPGYLETMRIELLAGRDFTPDDDAEAAPVLIVNETLATRFFPDENPVGKRVTFSDPTDPEATWREIVGVARDIRNFGIREGSRNAVYLPWAQAPRFAAFPVLRASVPPASLAPAVRAAVAELDPALAVAQVRTMEEIVRAEVAADRFVATLLSMFAVVTLVLAVVGLYGVVSYGVSTRIREMGVMMALGAGAGRISRNVIGRSLLLVAAGVAAGLVAAWLSSGLVSSLLFGVDRFDPLTYAGVVAVLVASATLAAGVPALRATRVDPSVALRVE